MQETGVQSLGQEDVLEKEMATHSSTLAWKSHGQRSLVGYSPWGHKESGTWLLPSEGKEARRVAAEALCKACTESREVGS